MPTGQMTITPVQLDLQHTMLEDVLHHIHDETCAGEPEWMTGLDSVAPKAQDLMAP